MWLWISLIAMGIGAYLIVDRSDPLPTPESAEGVLAVPKPPTDVSDPPSPTRQDSDALKPATGIADDAAEAVRRMNEDAQQMMNDSEMTPNEER